VTIRERILAVYAGETPDVVPCMLDLSHWFYHRHHMPWDLSKAYFSPERELLDCHRRSSGATKRPWARSSEGAAGARPPTRGT